MGFYHAQGIHPDGVLAFAGRNRDLDRQLFRFEPGHYQWREVHRGRIHPHDPNSFTNGHGYDHNNPQCNSDGNPDPAVHRLHRHTFPYSDPLALRRQDWVKAWMGSKYR